MPELEFQRFSESIIWDQQSAFFEHEGVDAWKNGVVPHYITNNPIVGVSYAEAVLALLKDLAVQGHKEGKLYLLELGAGHGQLAYHFLKYFEKHYHLSTSQLPSICYILSDFVPSNVSSWSNHPRFQPYFENGWLDTALFDATTDTEIQLQHAGISITSQALELPIVVIANYFFDTIPQELLRIHDGKISQVAVRPTRNADPVASGAAMVDPNLEFSYQEMSGDHFPGEPLLNGLIEFYRKHLSDTHLLFPHVGIRCLERLKSLSKKGIMILSADKGEHHLSELEGQSFPIPVLHGSFSLMVNYHAFKKYIEIGGGIALFPNHQHSNLALGCMLGFTDPQNFPETQQVYQKFVQDYGPDDYFNLKRIIERSLGTLRFEEVMAMTRLSKFDSRLFLKMIPDLKRSLNTMTDSQRLNLLQMIPRLWETYFPLNESQDFALELGNLLFSLKFYQEALLYYEKSIIIYGEKPIVLHKMALCFFALENYPRALELVMVLKNAHPKSGLLMNLENIIGLKIQNNGSTEDLK